MQTALQAVRSFVVAMANCNSSLELFTLEWCKSLTPLTTDMNFDDAVVESLPHILQYIAGYIVRNQGRE